MIERVRITFSGYVQGVGFRYTAKMLADHFALTGWVHNSALGHVELEAQGERTEIDSYIAQLKERMADNISEVKIEPLECVGGEDIFVVQY